MDGTEQNHFSKIFNAIAVYSIVWEEKVCKLRTDREKNWEGSWENRSVIIYGKKERNKKNQLTKMEHRANAIAETMDIPNLPHSQYHNFPPLLFSFSTHN